LSRELSKIPIQPGKFFLIFRNDQTYICGKGTETGENTDDNRFLQDRFFFSQPSECVFFAIFVFILGIFLLIQFQMVFYRVINSFDSLTTSSKEKLDPEFSIWISSLFSSSFGSLKKIKNNTKKIVHEQPIIKPEAEYLLTSVQRNLKLIFCKKTISPGAKVTPVWRMRRHIAKILAFFEGG
jgi:hypothetical protein